MYEALTGKKLLILGATAGETVLVERARELGIYTIVTDYHTDRALSPAKAVADESWDLSWSDTDALEAKCRQVGVDGITAGYSEFRIESLIRLCQRLDLPCYATMEQLDITRDKVKFKSSCVANGVPVIRDYPCQEAVDSFPVIVKPVDRAGSIGISVATDREELSRACQYALQESVVKQIIIEKFIDNGRKIDLYYAVEDGEISLLTSTDVINARDNGYERVVQSAWLYPSRDEAYILEKSDAALRKMIQSMGIRYGCIFFSGFLCEDGELAFFECGFRLEGGHQHNYVNQRGPYHYLDLFLLHALTGSTALLPHRPEDHQLKCVTANLYAKAGTVSSIQGVSEIAAMDNCVLALPMSRVGELCRDDRAILKKLALFQFTGHDPAAIARSLEEMYRLFSVQDEQGKDMIYDRIDTGLIPDWWTSRR